MTGRGKMEFKVQLVVVSEDGREDIEEAVHLEKGESYGSCHQPQSKLTA